MSCVHNIPGQKYLDTPGNIELHCRPRRGMGSNAFLRISMHFSISVQVTYYTTALIRCPPHSPILRATPLLASIPNSTMLIELSGIKMAATMGERAPCTAKLRPMML